MGGGRCLLLLLLVLLLLLLWVLLLLLLLMLWIEFGWIESARIECLFFQPLLLTVRPGRDVATMATLKILRPTRYALIV